MNKKKFLTLGLTLAITASSAFCSASHAAIPPAPPAGHSQNLPGNPPPDAPHGQFQESNDASSFKGTLLVDGEKKSASNQTIITSETDTSNILVRKQGNLNIINSTLTKAGDSNDVNDSNFTGRNAIVLANNSNINISSSTLASAAEGANAVFATGKNSTITAQHLKITTSGNSSRGLDATYGGKIIANDVDITTQGQHCAAVATDRGEGNIDVSSSKLTTSGDGSPCIYSTGSISVSDSTGLASGSEIAVVEGKNSITLNNVELTGKAKHGVMLYQSFSGDADTGTASFTAKNSKLSNESNGSMFYVTNTTADINLKQNTLNNNSSVLLEAASDRWGNESSNGGDVSLTAVEQELNGDIVANDISIITLTFGDGTNYTGAINKDHTAADISLKLTAKATVSLTADAYLTLFDDEDTSFSNIKSNGYNIYYQKSSSPQLAGKTYSLPGGGVLQPIK